MKYNSMNLLFSMNGTRYIASAFNEIEFNELNVFNELDVFNVFNELNVFNVLNVFNELNVFNAPITALAQPKRPTNALHTPTPFNPKHPPLRPSKNCALHPHHTNRPLMVGTFNLPVHAMFNPSGLGLSNSSARNVPQCTPIDLAGYRAHKYRKNKNKNSFNTSTQNSQADFNIEVSDNLIKIILIMWVGIQTKHSIV